MDKNLLDENLLNEKLNKRIQKAVSSFSELEGFTLKRLKEEGIAVQSLDSIIESAEKCLNSLDFTVEHKSFEKHFSIIKLGKKKLKKGVSANEEELSKIALYMARILIAYQEEIAVSVISTDNHMGEVHTNFVISSNAAVEPIISMMRSVYGNAEVNMLNKEQIPVFADQYYAEGRFYFKDRNTSEQEKAYSKYESWISAVLNSLPKDGNYIVSVRLIPQENLPQENSDCVKRKIQEINRLYNELSFYSELSWGNSENIGVGISHKGNLAETTVEMIVRSDKQNENISRSINLSAKEVDKHAQRLKEELSYAMTRLKTAERTSAWGVQISVSGNSDDTVQTLISVMSGILSEQRLQLHWNTNNNSKAFIANAEEILPILKFPNKEFAGFSFVENDEFSLISPSGNKEGFEAGKILWNSQPFTPFYLSEVAFSRHAFVCGMTGSGKSNTIFNIIEGINLPCVIIEPVKGEYRALRSVFSDMKVWTMKASDSENSSVSVLRINPFWFPLNANLAFHIDSIKTIIASSFELTAAMPNILEQCLYNVYINAGWDLITNKNIYIDSLPEEYLYPTFSDLCNEIESYLDKSDFGAETLGNYKGALLSRMKSFVNGYKGILLNTNVFPNYADFMNGHCVIELEGLADDADKCLVMGTILVQYYQYLKQNFKDSGNKKKLNHLIVIEEAHRLFKKTQKNKSAEGGSDPTGQLVESLSNMMAEIRAFGEGMLIVDQSPTKLADDVVKNSATKIIHRIDNGDDIQVLQSSMLLEDDTTSFAMLKQGEALVRTDKMTKPCKVLMNCNMDKEQYSLSDTFAVSSTGNSDIREWFIATAVLYNEEIVEDIQKYILICLNSLSITDFTLWYDVIGDLLYSVICVLKNYKVYDMVDFRISVLFKIILLSIKKDVRYKSKKDMGLVHMFLTCIFDFYDEKRNGAFVKDDVVRLWNVFFYKHIKEILIYKNLEGVSHYLSIVMNEITDNFKEDDVLISIIMNYCDKLLPIITEESDSETVKAYFYEQEFALSSQEVIQNAYSDIFTHIYNQIDLLNIKQKIIDSQ